MILINKDLEKYIYLNIVDMVENNHRYRISWGNNAVQIEYFSSNVYHPLISSFIHISDSQASEEFHKVDDYVDNLLYERK